MIILVVVLAIVAVVLAFRRHVVLAGLLFAVAVVAGVATVLDRYDVVNF